MREAPLRLARDFFAMPAAEKDRVHIRHSPHFRGYSEMKNSRDWREQIHFGLERDPAASPLQGPNLWPGKLGAEWRDAVLAFLAEAGATGQRILADLGLPAADDPYLPMKMICYHPQPSPEAAPRPGVAAHCDWSWITLLYQDSVGGLEEQRDDGSRVAVDAAFSVTIGELAEIATGGRLRARPHRVVNRSSDHQRISVPVFICPPLEYRVAGSSHCFTEPHGHVHRVRDRGKPWPDVPFGESEWRRKGLGRWCWRDSCVDGG